MIVSARRAGSGLPYVFRSGLNHGDVLARAIAMWFLNEPQPSKPTAFDGMM
jgi:hypothetical protein